jgi:hypothetical protein
MADIMLQKYLAMGCSAENWNDMRRFNYSAGNIGNFGVVYPGYQRGPLFAGQAEITGTSPTDPMYWMRRWRLPATLELQYNATNAGAANSKAFETNIWCYPIWWDLCPRPVNTFLEKYDFSGKTVIPFATSGGSSIAHSVRQLRKLYPNVTWNDGKLLNGGVAVATEWAKQVVENGKKESR